MSIIMDTMVTNGGRLLRGRTDLRIEPQVSTHCHYTLLVITVIMLQTLSSSHEYGGI